MTGVIVVNTTTSTKAEAELIAEQLVTQGLAACVQIAAIDSLYRWKGELTRDIEYLMSVKTRESLFSKVEAVIRAAHSYETPEVVALPVTHGSSAYLAWLMQVTGDETRD